MKKYYTAKSSKHKKDSTLPIQITVGKRKLSIEPLKVGMNQSQQIENIDQHHARIDITKLAERVFQLEEWKNSMD